MDQACILCDHPRIGHFGTGCHRNSFLRGNCDCDFVEPPTMSPAATAEQHRDRAAWWARRVDATDREMARGGHSSDRWLRLDRFRRAAETERLRHLETARALRVAEAATAVPGEPETGADPRAAVSDDRSGADGDLVASSLELAMRGTLDTEPFEEAMAREFRDTFGDRSWAQTHTQGDVPERDEAFLGRYRAMRARLETYWRHWAAAPHPGVQHAVMTQHPDAFRRQMRLAIQVLTPPERARFRDRRTLFGWVASGMWPLFVEDVPVPLAEIVEERYLAPHDPDQRTPRAPA